MAEVRSSHTQPPSPAARCPPENPAVPKAVTGDDDPAHENDGEDSESSDVEIYLTTLGLHDSAARMHVFGGPGKRFISLLFPPCRGPMNAPCMHGRVKAVDTLRSIPAWVCAHSLFPPAIVHSSRVLAAPRPFFCFASIIIAFPPHLNAHIFMYSRSSPTFIIGDAAGAPIRANGITLTQPADDSPVIPLTIQFPNGGDSASLQTNGLRLGSGSCRAPSRSPHSPSRPRSSAASPHLRTLQPNQYGATCPIGSAKSPQLPAAPGPRDDPAATRRRAQLPAERRCAPPTAAAATPGIPQPAAAGVPQPAATAAATGLPGLPQPPAAATAAI